MKTKFSSKKLMASFLVALMAVATVGFNIFGSASELYAGYIKGNTILGENQYLTDPAARDMYNDLIFVTGAPGSASASGYGSFYTYRSTITGAYNLNISGTPTNPVTGGDGQAYTIDDIKPIGNIKWVLHDGVLVITNDWTDADIEAQVNHSASESLQQAARNSMTTMDMLNYYTSYLKLTPFRDNANIETIIIGENVDINTTEDVFVDCTNIKNIICLDGMSKKLVEGASPEYVILRETQTSGALPVGTQDMSAEKIAYQSSNDRMDFVAYTPGSKGTLNIGVPTYTPPIGGQAGTSKWTYPDAATVTSQYATAKSYIADMNLPDWALAFLPTEMGGTGTARTVSDVFNFETATLKSNWNDSTGTVTETPVTEPEAPVATTVTYSDWAEGDIMNAGRKDYLDTLTGSNAPAVTDLLGSDFTKAITRGQFAALSVRFYEEFMSGYNDETVTVPVATGDDVFADSIGNEAMAKAYNLGILGGYNSAPTRAGVSVGPNDMITRQQAATMLARLMSVIDEETGRDIYHYTNYNTALPFVDSVADWAMDGVKTVYYWGIMTGTSGTTFSGQSNYTIEQSIVTLMRIDDWGTMGAG